MKIAIITPYYKEKPEILKRCIDSVKDQTTKADHILVADGHPVDVADYNIAHHIVLPNANGDYGDTPRMIGSIYAYSQGYDAYCWLDADNWFEPNHLEKMLEIIHLNPEAEIVTATRNLRRPDASLLAVDNESNGVEFCDTNCYFITRDAMPLANKWGFKDKSKAILGDREVWAGAAVYHKDHCKEPTVNYTTMFGLHYVSRGETAPEGCKVIVSTDGGANYSMWSFDQYLAHIEKTKPQ